MKIVSIRFLNLNSLKGEHKIFFDKPPFTESGLFAITGPTGAGKTTILDAITLALYGKVHRHDKEDPSEIMTRHTGESYSEVEFEVKDILYRAKWSNYRAHKKAGGKLQGPKMELSNARTNEIIENGSLFRYYSKIIEVCGLDYNQFLRSVILSQGDFTRFLKANENERSDLLEKITDTAIYSEISMFIFSKTREEKDKLETVQTRFRDVVLLPDEEKNAYNERIFALRDDEKKSKIDEDVLKEKLGWVKKIHQLKIKKDELTTALQCAENIYTDNEPQFKKLKTHHQALAYKPALVQIKTVEEQIQKIKQNINAYKEQQPLLQSAVDLNITTLEESKRSRAALKKELVEIEPVFEMVIKKDAAIESEKLQLAKTNQIYNDLNKSVDQLIKLYDEVVKDFNIIKKRTTELKEWLLENKQDEKLDKELIVFTNHAKELKRLQASLDAAYMSSGEDEKQLIGNRKLLVNGEKAFDEINKKIKSTEEESTSIKQKLEAALSGKTLAEIENNLSVLPGLIHVCAQQLKLSKSINQNKKDQLQLEREIEQFNKLHIDESGILTQLEKDKDEANENLIDLQKLFELEVRIQKYDKEREQLQPEKPCPLCGSLHHPYVHNQYKSHLSQAEERRNEQRQILKQINQQWEEKSLLVNTLFNKLNAVGEKKQELNGALITGINEFETNNQQLSNPLDYHKSDVINTIIIKKKEEETWLRKIIKDIKELQEKNADNDKDILKQHTLLAQSAGKIDQAKAEMNILEKSLEIKSKEIEQVQEKIKTSEAQMTILLEAFHLSFDKKQIENIASLLYKRFKIYSDADKEYRQLELELKELESDEVHKQQSLKEKRKTLEEQAAGLKEETEKLKRLQEERYELFANKNPNTERQSLNRRISDADKRIEILTKDVQQKQQEFDLINDRISENTNELTKYNEAVDRHTQALVEQLKEKGIASIDALQLLFLDDENANAIDRLQKDATQKIASGQSLLKATENELDLAINKKLTIETEDELVPKIEIQSEKLKEINQEIGKVSQILNEDERLKAKHKKVADEIEIQQKEYDRWNKLCSLIGSESGKKFSRFAQGLTLARLTELANRHLLQLSDRYQILKTKEKDLELQIMDGYQADVVRPMSTLSGGESFLVSLALALGLSDLASRKVQINSLFIDEGFGTLDPDTLEIAINALENLQANGKSIGVISHVDALKDRIGTQIQVSKHAGGYSKIQVVSYGQQVVQVD